ncbi:MAG: pantoate--beta-alanine ligase [Flavobacteriaceae bacterium]|nr:pantoate--beta-alanine ligase [Flavobacteriaceae bacterium]
MKIHNSIESLQKELLPFLKDCKSIGFVPTMGALHKGHVSLVEQACKENECVVVSIFVNPTQFNNAKDLEKYPRTIEGDIALLKNVKGNIFVFLPNASDLYQDQIISKKYDFSGIENEMEGKHRQGHFDGVGTVLNIFFRTVKPNKAYFGEKDFQQLQIVKKLVEIENLPVKIIGCPIVREASGLAMSSRNKRLDIEALNEATLIYKTLSEVKVKFQKLSISELNLLVKNKFNNNDVLSLEYFEIADVSTLKTALDKKKNTKYRAFIASFIDGVRLIDNMALN